MCIVNDKAFTWLKSHRSLADVCRSSAVVPASRSLGGVVGIHVKVGAVCADLLDSDVASALCFTRATRLPRCAICLDRRNALDVNGR